MTPDAELAQLLASMTWAEKLAQLQIIWTPDTDAQHEAVRRGIGAMFWPADAAKTNELQRIAREETRLGIPLLIGLDVVHGQFTIFPTPLAQAASFDPDVAAEDARNSARESRSNGVNWTFSPMVDVSMDPRWGRVVEGFGESPHLSAAFARAKVAAYQGADLAAPTSLASCLKHFVAYGAAEAGRDYNTTDVSRRRLRDVYLAPFAAGVEAGAASVMAAFNSLNGTPMHAHRRLLTDVLKDEYGFDGVVVGDADGASQLRDHGVVAAEKEALALSLSAGVDVVMGGDRLADAVADTSLHTSSDIAPDRVDDAVYRVLALKKALGLFDRPYVDPERAVTAPSIESLQSAQQTAERSIILLKNEPALLPMSPTVRRVHVVGPYATSTDHLGAWVQRFAAPAGSLAQTLPQQFPQIDWSFDDAVDFLSPAPIDRIQAAAASAAAADLVIVAVGEPNHLSGEASSRSDLRLPGDQEALIHAVADTGVPFVVVVVAGRPLVTEAWIERAGSVLFSFHLGTRGPEALGRVIGGEVNPAGRVPMTFPRAVGQIPIYHEHENTGRPARTPGSLHQLKHDVEIEGPNNVDDSFSSKFLDLELGPRFEFGHGLSYTTFALSDVTLSRSDISLGALANDDGIDIHVTVTNTGDRDGETVIQFYVSDPVATVAQPLRRLRGFTRVAIAAGGSADLQFHLAREALTYWTDDEVETLEPGEFIFTVSDGTQASTATMVVST